ncbi:hypothetical protein Q4Q34_19455 [Flavivirga abyssicola]|uniref:hypothetical protein n=1 Tax=Flavivirga abyssicola TaxID=3063533 RepID=UPI0026E05662|nr:hypothetical protein [Flavivirga sp. MEBiC07777]WVK13394.1 hypothetical protein Q4Q34_19455 [Flavivirga sp. MEBiC07777]
MTEQDVERGRKNAIISYITIFGVIIAYYLNNEKDKKSPFASFHIRQSLGLWLTLIIINLSIVSKFDIFMLRASVYIFFSVLYVYGLSNAISGKAQKVPLVGNLYQKVFANLGK